MFILDIKRGLFYLMGVMAVIFSKELNSQICIKGKILVESDTIGLSGVEIRLKDHDAFVVTDFDGLFKLKLDSKQTTNDLLIKYDDLIVEVTNINFTKEELNLIDFHMPMFKNIDVREYQQLSKSDKEHCFPIYCWAQLLGYTNHNRLENEKLQFNCKEKTEDFIFDPKKKTVKVNWDRIKKCI